MINKCELHHVIADKICNITSAKSSYYSVMLQATGVKLYIM